jgi:uncharacterized membrane protein YhaH (DUF805 family)
MEYMFMPLKRYFDFSGRSRRKEYWFYLIFFYVVMFVAMYLDTALGLGGTTTSSSEYGDGTMSASASATGGILTLIWALLNLIPLIAVAVRRCHDNDKSGWFVLIPIYGAIIVLFLEGTRGPNRFGPDPKGGAGDAQQAFN